MAVWWQLLGAAIAAHCVVGLQTCHWHQDCLEPWCQCQLGNCWACIFWASSHSLLCFVDHISAKVHICACWWQDCLCLFFNPAFLSSTMCCLTPSHVAVLLNPANNFAPRMPHVFGVLTLLFGNPLPSIRFIALYVAFVAAKLLPSTRHASDPA